MFLYKYVHIYIWIDIYIYIHMDINIYLYIHIIDSWEPFGTAGYCEAQVYTAGIPGGYLEGFGYRNCRKNSTNIIAPFMSNSLKPLISKMSRAYLASEWHIESQVLQRGCAMFGALYAAATINPGFKHYRSAQTVRFRVQALGLTGLGFRF